MLGKRLILAREKKGMKQVELAEALGVSKTCVNYWEKDKREPGVNDIKRLCSLLDVDADDLLGITPLPTEPQGTNNEQLLIRYYRQACENDRSVLLRIAACVAHAASTGYVDQRIPAEQRVLSSLAGQAGSLEENQEVGAK